MPYTIIPAQDPGTGTVAPGDLTGFTATRIPFGATSTALTDSADITYDDTTNDFTVSASESGGAVGIAVANTSNTASSSCAVTATVAGGTADDATFRSIVSGVTTWSWGVDNSDSDKWKLAPNADVGTSTALVIDTTGLIGAGAAVATGRRMTFGGTSTAYNRLTKSTATAGTWDFGIGAVLSSSDNHFVIADSTSSFAPRLTILGSTAGNQAADVVIGNLASDTVPAVLATNATGGFLRLPTCAGTPTGAAVDGSIVVDTTNHKLYFRSGGTWRDSIGAA